MSVVARFLRGGGWLGCMVVAACACAGDARRPAAEPEDERRKEAWNGGKVQAPVFIQSSLEGEVTTDQATEVTVTVTPQAGCRALTTRLRGVEGVEVAGDRVDHAACEAGRPVVHTARVRVPPGVAGYLVVDVALELAEGRRMTAVRSFDLRQKGAARREKKTGNVTYDENGRPIVVMPAETR